MKNALPCLRLPVFLFLILNAGSIALTAQAPTNDNCAGAINLIPSPNSTCSTTTNGTTVGATQTLPSGSYAGTAEDDVWYKFTATAVAHIVTVDGAGNFRAVVEAKSSACNGTYINCVSAAVNGDVVSLALWFKKIALFR